MNHKQKAKWERTRAKGMWRFVLLYGVVLSVATIVATSIFDHFTSPFGLTPQHIMIRLPFFLIGGFVAGAVTWFVSEYQYQKSGGDASLNG